MRLENSFPRTFLYSRLFQCYITLFLGTEFKVSRTIYRACVYFLHITFHFSGLRSFSYVKMLEVIQWENQDGKNLVFLFLLKKIKFTGKLEILTYLFEKTSNFLYFSFTTWLSMDSYEE